MRGRRRAKNCKEDGEGKNSLKPVNPISHNFEESIIINERFDGKIIYS